MKFGRKKAKSAYKWGIIAGTLVLMGGILYFLLSPQKTLEDISNMHGVQKVYLYESGEVLGGIFSYRSSKFLSADSSLCAEYESYFHSAKMQVSEMPKPENSTFGRLYRGAVIEFHLKEQDESCPYEPIVILTLDVKGFNSYNAMATMIYKESESYRRFGKANETRSVLVHISDNQFLNTEKINAIIREEANS